MKKTALTVTAILLWAFIVTTEAGPVSASDSSGGNISIVVDGRLISPDVPPYFQNGRTMVPFRFIAEALGCRVTWDEQRQSVRAERNGQLAYLYVGKPVMVVNELARELDAAPVIMRGRTFVPLRAVSEAMGFQVEWDQGRQSVIIQSPGLGNSVAVSAEKAAIIIDTILLSWRCFPAFRSFISQGNGIKWFISLWNV